jgi:hypothetical protein
LYFLKNYFKSVQNVKGAGREKERGGKYRKRRREERRGEGRGEALIW